jgi:hypothetical protein
MDATHNLAVSESEAAYTVADHAMSAGSTLGAPQVTAVVKATGALEKVYSVAAGEVVLGTLVLHHWDERAGLHLAPRPGTFVIHPAHQEHQFSLANGANPCPHLKGGSWAW